ncbi:MAG: hypothetical protein GY798_03665 [Hyphomicrobiales bacterium]|nr:hypothetical protein [Hyphomicrobiales bacterium]
MTFLDATKKINNSKLSELKLLKNRKFSEDKQENELVTYNGKYEFRLSGEFKVKNNKELKGTLNGIKVIKNGDEIYRLSELDLKASKFFDAVNNGDLDAFIPTMFEKKDQLEGSFFDDKLFGFKKDDDINAYGGDDVIRGGKGNDKLTGYTGKDAFVFDTKLDAKSNVDRIMDWNTLKKESGRDSIWLDKDIFTAFKGMGGEGLKKKYFVDGNKAKDDDDHILYHKKRKKIFYDEDGKGGEDKVLFATLKHKKSLSHDDFDII